MKNFIFQKDLLLLIGGKDASEQAKLALNKIPHEVQLKYTFKGQRKGKKSFEETCFSKTLISKFNYILHLRTVFTEIYTNLFSF